MELSSAGAVASAGTLRLADGVRLQHPWTPAGVVAGPLSNGAQALHFAVALCVLNDTYREAAALGVEISGVRVSADGGFDAEWRSTGITYWVDVDSAAPADVQTALLDRVDRVAEMPKVIRAGTQVRRGH